MLPGEVTATVKHHGAQQGEAWSWGVPKDLGGHRLAAEWSSEGQLGKLHPSQNKQEEQN